MIKLLVGLGNPGKRFEHTRHNVGFMVLDALRDDENPCDHWRERHFGANASVQMEEQNIRLLKPLTMMNLSGRSVGEVARHYRVQTREIMVIHDDIDLAFPLLRIKEGGGHGGHNGLRSIDQHIGKGYRRLRFGIARPKFEGKDAVSNHVLSSFTEQEQAELQQIIRLIVENIAYLTKDLAVAQQLIAMLLQKNLQQGKGKWASPAVS